MCGIVAYVGSRKAYPILIKGLQRLEYRGYDSAGVGLIADHNKKIVTYVRQFDKFYKAEAIHQDYYQVKFLNYLRYKKACGREKILDNIWN